MMSLRDGRQISPSEAVSVFHTMPAQWQLATLNPQFVELDARRDDSLHAVHWLYEERDQRLLHSFHLSDNPKFAVKDIQSAYGYGGPLANTDDHQFLHAADRSFEIWARANSVIAEFLRFHPLVPHATWYSGQVIDNRETVYIDLGKDLVEQYQARRRTYVRRFLERKLRIARVSSGVMQAVFPAMYAANMDQVGAAAAYYFPEVYFNELFCFEGCENWLVYDNGTAIAGAIMLVSAQARVAEYHLGAKVSGYDRHRALAGLLHTAASHYQSLAFLQLYLGGGRSTDPDDSLLSFKKGFSATTRRFQVASRVYEPDRYASLRKLLPDKASTGRILFYKD